MAVALSCGVNTSCISIPLSGQNFNLTAPGRLEIVRSYNVQLARGPVLERQTLVEAALNETFPTKRWYVVFPEAVPREVPDVIINCTTIDGPQGQVIISSGRGMVQVDSEDLLQLSDEEFQQGIASAVGAALKLSTDNVVKLVNDADPLQD